MCRSPHIWMDEFQRCWGNIIGRSKQKLMAFSHLTSIAHRMCLYWRKTKDYYSGESAGWWRRMTKAIVPLLLCGLELVTQQSSLEWRHSYWRDWVQPSFTCALKKNGPRDSILYKKMIRMEFKENIIVGCKTVCRKEMFASIWSMKHILKLRIFDRSWNKRLTNVSNSQTWTVCSLNLLLAMILATHSQSIKVISDVISCTWVTTNLH